MKQRPRIGTLGQLTTVVEKRHVIDFADDRMPAVLSTPTLVGLLESAARAALAPLLEPGESSVGVHVDLQHLAATPLGNQVTCEARVIHVEGTLITFQLEARDEHERVARGMHKRRVIHLDRFRRRVSLKEKGAAHG